MFPHTVTIYNKYKEGAAEKWQRTVLRGVLWNSNKGAVMRKTGMASADGLQLIIPFAVESERTYLKPLEFAAAADKSAYWTLGSKDTAILGEIDYEVIRSASELEKLYDDVLIISNVDTRDFGGSMAHWEVSGK